MYNYRDAMSEDIKNYLNENEIKVTYSNRHELELQLYDEFFVDDSITGNASGSYTFNSCKAAEYVRDNEDLLRDTLIAFGYEIPDCYDFVEYMFGLHGAEWCDVIIRCYLLYSVLHEVLDEVECEDEEEE